MCTLLKGWSVLFDLDGTLVDTAPDILATLNYILTQNQMQTVGFDDFRSYVGMGVRGLLQRACEAQKQAFDEAAFPSMFDAFIAYYKARIAFESRPFEGVIQVLEACREQGAKLAVCTNKNSVLARQLLDELNLTAYFDLIVGPDSFGVSKPDPAVIAHCIQALGGDGDDLSRVVLVGDSYIDIRTAQAANICGIAISHGYNPDGYPIVGAQYTINHFSELMPILSENAVQ